MSKLEELFKLQLRAHKLDSLFVRECLFHPTRKWRFDFSCESMRIAVELQGGVFGKKSGHNSGVGIRSGMEKLNEAQRLGWRVYQFYVDEVKSGQAVLYIKAVIDEHKARLKEMQIK